MDIIWITTILPNWLTAIGTIGAVVFSLVVTLKSNKISYYAWANSMILAENKKEYIVIKIANKNNVPFTVESIYWIYKNSFFKKTTYYQTMDINKYSDNLPKKIMAGEYINILLDKKTVLNNLNKKITAKKGKIHLLFSTSLGETHEIKIVKPFMEIIRDNLLNY